MEEKASIPLQTWVDLGVTFHDVGDGWKIVWDATDIPAAVREAFEEARKVRQWH